MHGETAHLSLGKFDVSDFARTKLIEAILDFSGRQAVIVSIPLVKADGKLANGLIPAPRHILKDALDRLPDVRVGLGRYSWALTSL